MGTGGKRSHYEGVGVVVEGPPSSTQDKTSVLECVKILCINYVI